MALDTSSEKLLLGLEKDSRKLRGLNGKINLNDPEIDDFIRNARLSIDQALVNARAQERGVFRKSD